MLPLPLTSLIRQLRAAGFSLDPGREMQLRKVVHERAANYVGRFGEMKYLLAPFVASRPEEQRNFYAFWDRYVAELEQKWASEEKTAAKASSVGSWRWVLLPLLALLAYGAFRFFNPKPPALNGERYAINIGLPDAKADSVYDEYIRLTEGDTLRLENRTKGKLRNVDSTGFQWRVEDVTSGETVFLSGDFDLDMARPLVQGEGLRVILEGLHLELPERKAADTLLFVVQCSDPPRKPEIRGTNGLITVGAKHGFSVVNPERGVVYDWGIENHGIQGVNVRHEFTSEGRTTIEVRAIRGDLANIDLCYTAASAEVLVVPKDDQLPLLARYPLVKDTPHSFASRSSAYKWGKWFVLALILVPLLWWKHRRETEARREKTDEEIAEAYPVFDQGPYSIPYRNRNDQISVPADFYRIADHLRVREASEVQVFDGAATIEATVSSGGFPTWRERSLNRPADYLVLVTHNDEFNQQDLLLKRLIDFLSSREAAITVYYHEGQFERFWNNEYPQGWSPDRLFDRYQQFRLLVLGNAHGLVDVYASREPRLVPEKARWFNGWGRRLILTTEPAADWTAQEVLLYRSALLYPITMRGLDDGLRKLNETEEFEPDDFVKWRSLQQRYNPEPPARYRTWETVADHQEYLREDPELMRWLCGLAVTGNPDWNLTITIGRALDVEVTHDRLLQLSRIPWLAGNRPDHDLRFALLERLTTYDEERARRAVMTELELVKDPVRESFAQTEWQTSMAVHQLHLAPASAPQKESLREMIRAGLFTTDQLHDLELAAQRKEEPETEMQSKFDAPPVFRPGGLDRLLEKEESEWWDLAAGKRFLGILVVMVGLALLALSMLTPERQLEEGQTPPWWAEVSVVDDLALETNNEAVDLWKQTETSIGEKDGEIGISDATALGSISSLLKEARDLRGGTYPLAEKNEQLAYFNNNAYRINAAYLDVASDKEIAFRDLLEEDLPEELPAIATDEKLWVDLIHQDGLVLLGLHKTLNEKYPLNRFSKRQINQIQKEFPTLEFLPEEGSDTFLATGKLDNGTNVADLRVERDTLLQRAITILENIENLTNREYFDTLTLVMPVNLRTMVEAIQDTTARGNSQEVRPPQGGENQNDRPQGAPDYGENPASDRFESMKSGELLSFIQQSGDSRAFAMAQAITDQASSFQVFRTNLMRTLAERSGGYVKGTDLLNPGDTTAVQLELIQGTAAYSFQTQLSQFANLLAKGYSELDVAGADERVAALTERFTDPSLNGQAWSTGAFRGKNTSEASLALEVISDEVYAAEKAYLVALAESLNQQEEY
ncbi:hypothetical protein FUA23_17230 [Neolewinella aurantiaca]|uniref:Uncharacterized protein n=1 Tax=Neolewinella aurantiaca TaxID=2602767 RepID=A0A5C7FAX8_9BACT|nr:hypothetical protein [Neolewinella aurantiaca]TXF87801.1 hypothetical protein FUA23_17230 [Neolewinella aurantiaca]